MPEPVVGELRYNIPAGQGELAGRWEIYDGQRWIPLAQADPATDAALTEYRAIREVGGVTQFKRRDSDVWVEADEVFGGEQAAEEPLETELPTGDGARPDITAALDAERARALAATVGAGAGEDFGSAPDWWVNVPEPWPPLKAGKDTDPVTGANIPEFDRAAYLQYYREFGRVTKPQQEPQRDIDDLIYDALVKGDWGKATELDEWRRRPTQAQALELAIRYASSPADYLTLLQVLRDELPPFAQVGAFQRVAPESRVFDIFGFGRQGLPRPKDTLQTRREQEEQAGIFTLPPDVTRETRALPERRQKLPDDVLAEIDAGRRSPPPGFDPITGTVPVAVGRTEAEIVADLQRLGNDILSGAISGLAAQARRAELYNELAQAKTTEPQRLTPVARTSAVIESELLDLGNRFQRGEIDLTSFRERRAALARELELARTRPLGVQQTGQAGRRRLSDNELAEIDAGTRPAPFGFDPRTGTVPEREPTRLPVPSGTGGRPGGFQLDVNLLPKAVREVGLFGRELPFPKQFPAIGGLMFPSRQALDRMLPTERAFFRRAVELQGIPFGDYEQQLLNTIGRGEGPSGVARFLPRPVRVRA